MRPILRWIAGLLAATLLPFAVQAGTRPEDHAITAAHDIVVEGSNVRVRGDIHANGNVLLRGRVTVEGTAEAGRTVQLGPNTRVTRVVRGAPATGTGAIDFAALRRRATRVLTGDQHFRDANLISGILYIGGSVVVDGIVGGQGMIVAEQEIRLRGRILAPGTLDLIAGARLFLQGTSFTIRGTLQSPGHIRIAGNDLVIQGALIGGDVHVSGNNIQILGQVPSVGQPPALGVPPSPGGQPPVGVLPIPPQNVLAPPTIIQPQTATRFWADLTQVPVSGTATPGARIRLTLRHLQTQRETTMEVTTDAAGRFSASFLLPSPRSPGALGPIVGDYSISAVVVGLGGRTSEVATVTFQIALRPERENP